jgi:bifunctional DNA-binding transcriptional regulator/antitoxin component of YhaV-PrlF toxin-antitoxin module
MPMRPLPASGALYGWSTYNAPVTATSNAKVSHRGQTSLPAELRHRWGIDQGGEVGFIDLGDAALVVPGGVAAARRELRRVLLDRYEHGLAAVADPDLADQ